MCFQQSNGTGSGVEKRKGRRFFLKDQQRQRERMDEIQLFPSLNSGIGSCALWIAVWMPGVIDLPLYYWAIDETDSLKTPGST
jgi:hypothetical protein